MCCVSVGMCRVSSVWLWVGERVRVHECVSVYLCVCVVFMHEYVFTSGVCTLFDPADTHFDGSAWFWL